jgi:hypothetical protein
MVDRLHYVRWPGSEDKPYDRTMSTAEEDLHVLLYVVDSMFEYDTGTRVERVMDLVTSLVRKYEDRTPFGWGSTTAGIGWRAGAKVQSDD